MKVFLGGTANGSTWRQELIPMLEIDYFDPVVEDWDDAAHARELVEREESDFCLYVITPRMEGYYSLAEVADDSFKKADKTIYCYLPTDGELAFNARQLEELERIGRLVQANGAVWEHSLREIADFLNSAKELASDRILQQTEEINNAFISYGRRHSLAFAHRLFQSLKKRGLQVWFDMNDIPLGVDFQQQIDEGIRRSDNVIFIISPHSINSVYCAKELELALKYKKRIIPVLHVEPQDSTTWGNIHPEIARRNWVYFRQGMEQAMALSGEAYQLREKIVAKPEEAWGMQDDFDTAFKGLGALIDSHRAYIRTHTVLLDKALSWEKSHHATAKLLVGNERMEAEQWMQRSHQVFKNPSGHLIQPPCIPTDLVAKFIMESKKNGRNMQCDVFVCHHSEDRAFVDPIVSALHRHGFSTWIHDHDIAKGMDYETAIYGGVEQSATMLFFLSDKSLKSAYCQKEYAHAQHHCKRLIPLQLDKASAGLQAVAQGGHFDGLGKLQYIDFSFLTAAQEAPEEALTVEERAREMREVAQADVEARHSKTPFDLSMDELVHALESDRSYYEQHRIFLVQALRWQEQGQQPSHLLRGFNLENAQTWLNINAKRAMHPPTKIHHDFIHASEAARGQLGTDVFISYSRKDGDFARKLNTRLQQAGHTTWFDQESISKGVDFEKEIFKGIDGCDNFVFVISPDAVASEYCEREVNYAASQHKRIITLLWRTTEVERMPEALRTINWIDFETEEFGGAFEKLIVEVQTDREHAHAHTVWQMRAQEWDRAAQSPDYLLNASAHRNAAQWHASASGKRPEPTALQQAYIEASHAAILAAQEAERQRQEELQEALAKAEQLLVTAEQAQQEAEEAQRQAEQEEQKALKNLTRVRQIAGGAVLLALIAGGVGFYAYNKSVEAEEAKASLKATLEVSEQGRKKLYDQFVAQAQALVGRDKPDFEQAMEKYKNASDIYAEDTTAQEKGYYETAEQAWAQLDETYGKEKKYNDVMAEAEAKAKRESGILEALALYAKADSMGYNQQVPKQRIRELQGRRKLLIQEHIEEANRKLKAGAKAGAKTRAEAGLRLNPTPQERQRLEDLLRRAS